MFRLISSFLALSVLTATAFASEAEVKIAPGVDYTQQRSQVVAALADGETYAEIESDDRRRVLEALDRMTATLREADGNLAQLNDVQKVAVFNDQELINTTLTAAAEDSRVICKRERAVGSRLSQNKCETVAQRRRAREATQDSLNRSFKSGDLRDDIGGSKL